MPTYRSRCWLAAFLIFAVASSSGNITNFTTAPTAAPTDAPTAAPTVAPTAALTDAPTAAPTETPTAAPTETSTATAILVVSILLALVALAVCCGFYWHRRQKALRHVYVEMI